MRLPKVCVLVGALLLSGISSAHAAPDARDTELYWRECSGPHGERDPAALPLYQAVFAHDHDKAAKLVEQSSPNSTLYSDRWSPLMVAVAYQDRETVSVLLRGGTNINYVSADPADHTALGVAINSALGEALRSGGEHPKPDFSMFYYLLDAGADPNVEFGFHQDIAYFAATTGQYDILNQLLARGYKRDLPGLRKWILIGRVNSETQPAKDRAIATIDRLLQIRGKPE